MDKNETVLSKYFWAFLLLAAIVIVIAFSLRWWWIPIIAIGAGYILSAFESADNWGETVSILCIVAALVFTPKAIKTTINRPHGQNVGLFSNSQGKREPHVWICNGPQSKRYHNDPECKGLMSCSGEVSYVLKSEAEDMGRTPCGYCYGDAVPDW